MKQTPNAQRSTLNTQFSRASELEVGRWTFATAEPVQDGGGGLDVGRLLAAPL
jgi:hypothetical protein